MSNPLVLSPIEAYAEPFSYFVSPQALETSISFELLKWLELDAPWHLTKASFYEQYEFSFWEANLPSELHFLCEKSFLGEVHARVSRMFGVELSEKIDFTAHKLVTGQRIRVHNDHRPDGETHRLLIQLNRGWTQADGGLLMLFNSDNATDVHRIYSPQHNSSLGFAIGPDSHHAVSTINGGERYTVVFSFYEKR